MHWEKLKSVRENQLATFDLGRPHHIYPLKYSDRRASANRVDPDQTPQNAASDQGHRIQPIQYLETSTGGISGLVQIL